MRDRGQSVHMSKPNRVTSSLSDFKLAPAGESVDSGGMAARFVNIDHDTPLLLPPNVREWVPEGHMVHFVMDAVQELDLGAARVNHRGTGDAQYPPSMMTGLLIYCYATGTFSSRRIETLTHENVAVRLLCADTHPDHDSICKFRRENAELLSSCFHQVLELAAGSGVMRVGDLTVAMDGTKLLANASRHSAMSHDHVEKQLILAQEQIAELMAKAEDADSAPLRDGLSVPEEPERSGDSQPQAARRVSEAKQIARREKRIAKLKEAKAALEERARVRFEEEMGAHQEKVAAREAKEKETSRKSAGKAPKAPEAGPRPRDQYNFTDPESRIMKDKGGFQQCYNAQAAVEVESMLVVAAHVTDAANDKEQMVPTLEAVASEAGEVARVLVDSGYYSEKAVATVEDSGHGPTVYAATGCQPHGRSVAQLEQQSDPPPPPPEATPAEIMAHRVRCAEGKQLYGLRKQTVEPVFGIIKEAIGFRRFSMRGLAKVNLEWSLVSTAYNLKRLFSLGAKLANA